MAKKKNYYIGVLVSNGEIKIAYKIEDKSMYWETYEEIIKNGHKPLKWTIRHSVDSFISGLIINGNIAFVIDSPLDLIEDIRVR